MSVEATSVGSSPDLNETERQLEEYLLDEADDVAYFKSRLIAKDLDLSSKSVGHNMRTLADASGVLSIEKWGYSGATTWMVQIQE
ncbi:hypothetical protein [Halorubrum sp. AJ67]|uniref:DUF7123 family protein n=1 Tax=Halorubrum sp. AJ67 TaxID=1173487 RepID=UPI0003DC0BBE|nr:hypothetical protein [Halorubrum sp. AJ67]CDK38185.1 uncharacterized protein BN903_385 [Halorubrum sp. AJ67]